MSDTHEDELTLEVGRSFRAGRMYAVGVIHGTNLPPFSRDELVPVTKGIIAELGEMPPFILKQVIHNLHAWIDGVGGIEAAGLLVAHGGEKYLSPEQLAAVQDALKV